MLYNHALAILGLRSWVSGLRFWGLSAQVSVLGGSQVSSFQFPVSDLGFRGSSVGLRSQVLGFGVRGLVSGVQVLGSQVSGLRARVCGLGFGSQVSGKPRPCLRSQVGLNLESLQT